jgi:thermolabile hemolysin
MPLSGVFLIQNSWFLGHFSNGLVWTEYLAQSKNMPVYNWAVGGAAGANQYVALTGVTGQVNSYLQYMGKAQNYRPENTLYTLVFGLNDFMNYNRDVAEVEADFTTALQRLTQSGAQNILMMTLPDVTKAPQFTYSTPAEIDLIRGKITQLNTILKQLTAQYIVQGYAIHLFDTHALFESMVAEPEKHGFTNASEPCLNLTRSSAADYLYRHPITNTCARDGADKFVFWDVTHPTTAIHRYISQKLLAAGNGLQYFNF